MTRSEFIEQFTKWFDPEPILQLARQSRWQIRQGKIKALEFLLGSVFGEMSALGLSLSAQASTFTEPVSRQAVDQRYHPRTVEFFGRSFGHCLAHSLAQQNPRPSWSKGLAEHFSALQLFDSSSFDCPESLAQIYPGCGGDASQANCKILPRYEYLRGGFEPLALLPGKRSDQGLAMELPALLAAHELGMFDKGFFKLEALQQIQHKQAYFLLPLPRSVSLRGPRSEGTRSELKLAEVLRVSQEERIEWPVVYLGPEGMAVRMVAFRLSPESAGRRRAALREAQRKQGRVPTADALELAGWLILITNAPADKLPAPVMSYVYRVRWQIELIFKQCKSVLRLHVTQAKTNSDRVQCEIWARLIAAVVVFSWHSYLQDLSWARQRRELSFAQIARQLRQHGMSLAQALIEGGQRLHDYVGTLLRHLLHTTVKGRQRTRKTTLENLEENWPSSVPI